MVTRFTSMAVLPRLFNMAGIVIMGVAGCGKSTVGAALAEHFGFVYVEGDELHDASSIEKMSAGIGLTDDDRLPWLQRIGEQLANSAGPMVISCSALKRSYRDLIRLHAGKSVLFLHLSAPQPVIAKRMEQRAGHFMPPALLDSQFQTLEPLSNDETGTEIDITRSLEQVIDDASNVVARTCYL